MLTTLFFILMISLSRLFDEFPFPLLEGAPSDIPIANITADSREAREGSLFVAMTGGNTDGHRYIADAVQRGAVAILGEKPNLRPGVPYLRVENSRRALAYLSAAFYGFPARHLRMIGVTGTDGKTTTSSLLYHILLQSGINAGMITTVNAVIGDKTLDTGFHVTTPDAPQVQHYLAQMLDANLTHVILETTSHGWAQYRVDACEFDIGIVTNITHEHLDYHGSYEAYRAAKARLFLSLKETKEKRFGSPRLSVLNRDDSSYAYLSRIAPGPQVSYALDAAADIRAEQVTYSPRGIQFLARSPEFSVPVTSSLVGAYNISNILAAMAAAIFGLEISPELASKAVASFPGVPGRMERIHMGQDFTAIVDFAHTPNALRSAIAAVRQMTTGRVIVAFGSAGLRDKEKRRMMAEIAAEHADYTVLTAEDPRTESLDAILEEMAAGAESKGGVEGKTFWRIPDRGEAIRKMISLAAPGDVIMACGKGHEQSMCFGETEYPWDDRLAMRAALAEYLGMDSPKMPYLPTQG